MVIIVAMGQTKDDMKSISGDKDFDEQLHF